MHVARVRYIYTNKRRGHVRPAKKESVIGNNNKMDTMQCRVRQ